jgi:2'-5' RNA ligase
MFVAVWPDESTRKCLLSLRLTPFQGVSFVRPEQWHITLRFLGEVEDGLVPAITDSLESAAKTLAAVRCEVGPRTAWFRSDRVLQIPARGLDHVARAVHAATIPIIPDSSEGGLRFTGHLTVARAQGRFVDSAARTDLATIPIISTFDVDHFDLVKSEAANGGPGYTTVARLPMAL